MADTLPPIDPRRPPRARPYASVNAEPKATDATSEPTEQRVGITVSIADGFRFGCGLILAGVVFYSALVVVVAFLVGVAMLLNLPLPLGIGGH